MIYDLVIKNAKVYLNGTFQPCDVAVSGETISCVAPWGSEWQAAREIEAGGQYLIPGTIDTHVHFRDPGHPERETFYTGSMAAGRPFLSTRSPIRRSITRPFSITVLKSPSRRHA